MGLRLPGSVQMASKFGGMKPLQCSRAFNTALYRLLALTTMGPVCSQTFGLGQMTQDTYGKPYLHTFLAFINN